MEQVQAAALAEIGKIRKLRTDLKKTVTDLQAERQRLENELPGMLTRLERTEREIADLLPQVTQTERTLGEVLAARDRAREGLAVHNQRQSLLDKRSEAGNIKTSVKEDKPNLSISSTAAHEFCKVVSHVLSEWQFPGERHVSFDEKTYDLRIDGKLRTSNGKGVRAVTHAAFKVATLIFCREQNLPHPGFVVLDTPLLTYRDPIRNPRHGDLSDDEKILAQTALKQKFFEHLHSIRDIGQFIVLENLDLPEGIYDLTKIQEFTGHAGDGRFGFFPSR
ncbi:MAG: hypothetical protein H7840_14765 [Alphaproteobacteria bacterium]